MCREELRLVRLPYRGGSDVRLLAPGRTGAPLTAASVRLRGVWWKRELAAAACDAVSSRWRLLWPTAWCGTDLLVSLSDKDNWRHFIIVTERTGDTTLRLTTQYGQIRYTRTSGGGAIGEGVPRRGTLRRSANTAHQGELTRAEQREPELLA